MAEENKKAKKSTTEKKPGFLAGVKSEARKVTWYPVSTTIKNTIWVIIALVVFATVIGFVDWGFMKLLGLFA